MPKHISDGPDPRPGPYYVTVTRGNDYRLLSGPYPTHVAAMLDVGECSRIAIEVDPKMIFDAFGTARISRENFKEQGILNKLGKFTIQEPEFA